MKLYYTDWSPYARKVRIAAMKGEYTRVSN